MSSKWLKKPNIRRLKPKILMKKNKKIKKLKKILRLKWTRVFSKMMTRSYERKYYKKLSLKLTPIL